MIVANKADFEATGEYQGYNLPLSLHNRLADAGKSYITGWIDLLDHCASLDVENYAVFMKIRLAHPTKDAYVFIIYLAKYGEHLEHEVWNVYQNPRLCSKPEHLHGAQKLVTDTYSTCNEGLVSKSER